MLGQLESQSQIVIADFEAGLGTLSRVKEGVFDILLIVFEPTAKSIDVVRRALQMNEERPHGRIILVANRLRDEADRGPLLEAFPDLEYVGIPDDEAVRNAGVAGTAAIDVAASSPAVQSIQAMARTLVAV